MRRILANTRSQGRCYDVSCGSKVPILPMNPHSALTREVLALWREAEALIARGMGAEALRAAKRLCGLEPRNANVHLMAAAVAYTQGRLRESARHSMDASLADIRDAATLANTVMALLRTGEVAQAHRCMQHELLAGAIPGPLLVRLAGALQALECHADALALLDRAIATGFDNAPVRFQRSIELLFLGRGDEAEAELRHCLSVDEHMPGRASLMLSRQRRQSDKSNHLEELHRRLRRAAPGGEDRAAIEFALYKEFEDLGRYGDAWRALQRGNAIMASRLKPDAARHSHVVDGLIARSTLLPDSPPGSPSDSLPQPIFIVGMPRSGTTLLDRILGAHPQITSAGELGDFARQLRWTADHVGVEPVDAHLVAMVDRIDLGEVGRRYLLQSRWRSPTPHYVDKLPVNYQLAGLIARALPHARILHMVRDPMATCFSNYRAYFGSGYGYSYDLGALAARYRDYRRLMRHWHQTLPDRILDVDYAQLASDPEAALRAILSFCGIEYEAECLDLRRNRAPIATLSAAQMDQGIRAAEDAAWRRYEAELSAFRSALDA